MEKSILDFVELQDYIEEERERTEVSTTDDPSRACAIYCALHSAILFCCRENFMVINLDDVETLKFETGEYKGKTLKFICITSKYKDIRRLLHQELRKICFPAQSSRIIL